MFFLLNKNQKRRSCKKVFLLGTLKHTAKSKLFCLIPPT